MPRGIRRPPPKNKCGKVIVTRASGKPRKIKYARGTTNRGKLNLGKRCGLKKNRTGGGLQALVVD